MLATLPAAPQQPLLVGMRLIPGRLLMLLLIIIIIIYPAYLTYSSPLSPVTILCWDIGTILPPNPGLSTSWVGGVGLQRCGGLTAGGRGGAGGGCSSSGWGSPTGRAGGRSLEARRAATVVADRTGPLHGPLQLYALTCAPPPAWQGAARVVRAVIAA